MLSVINRLISKELLLLLSIALSPAAFCQTKQTDTLFVQSAAKNAREVYSESSSVQSHLYNGVQYKEYNIRNNDEGHPYFVSDDWLDGSIGYDGAVFENIPILYDLVNDKVVIEHGYSHVKLELISEKIAYFFLPGHRFVRLAGDAIRNSPVSTGFYELPYDGRVKFYVKWQKKLEKKVNTQEVLSLFLDNNRFLIYKDGKFIPVKSKSSVLTVFSDRKSVLRKYIRQSRIHFRPDRAQAIARVVKFYDESGN